MTTITTLRELERKATAGLWWHRKMHGQEVGFVERPVLDGEAYGVEILGDDNYPTLGARVARALSLGSRRTRPTAAPLSSRPSTTSIRRRARTSGSGSSPTSLRPRRTLRHRNF